ncbi:hypothetical protein [Archangium lansingense]|uniref:Peroxidase n=1 Tax=Archangium lansingense TaxID=2995310 RepID=A0ABT4AQ29_9BACT|nr:hypothetical protein [Archangium lansinium]MCY1082944.1 hypothetical protein [Archangium lansinium]
MSSNALTVVTPIQPDKVKDLDALLSEIGEDITNKTERHISFSQLTTVHFLRWVILPEDHEGKQYYQPQLAFESNYDGPLDAHLEELIRVGGPALARIYSYCAGCPANVASSVESFKRFLRLYQLPSAAFYRAYPNHTVQDVLDNTQVRRTIQDFLDDPGRAADLRGLKPEQLCQEIQKYLATVPRLKLERDPERPLSRLDRFVQSLMESRPVQLAVGIPAGVLLLPVLVPTVLALLWKESRDKAEPKTQDMVDPRVEGQEDYKVQNQLTHLVEIRPGWFRQLTLRTVLGGINFLARHYYNRGDLGGIPTIHFARWVIIDGGKRLLFFSNYDGSWERYLGDFIDQAAVGLTGVWSNTRGYPKTRMLFFKGATNEEDFKQWTRDHQVFTQVWYSAHADESVRNILQNVGVCAKLKTQLQSREAEQWLLKL